MKHNGLAILVMFSPILLFLVTMFFLVKNEDKFFSTNERVCLARIKEIKTMNWSKAIYELDNGEYLGSANLYDPGDCVQYYLKGGEVMFGDGYQCPTCGSWVGNYQVHYCYPRTYPTVTTPSTFYEPKEHCNHCYCLKDKTAPRVEEHRKCCKCEDIIL